MNPQPQTTFALSTNILFVDIETVPSLDPSKMSVAPPEYYKRFEKRLREKETVEEHYANHAGLYAEHGKIVCISIGQWIPGKQLFFVKSICSTDEKYILEEFAKVCAKPEIVYLAGHNIKEFDVPFLFRRYMINRVALPAILNLGAKKTWEYPYHDTMDLWGHAQWKYMASLDLIAELLGLPRSKGEMSGADVAPLYYSINPNNEDEVIGKIKTYGGGDVITAAHVFCHLKNLTPLRSDQIVTV